MYKRQVQRLDIGRALELGLDLDHVLTQANRALGHGHLDKGVVRPPVGDVGRSERYAVYAVPLLLRTLAREVYLSLGQDFTVEPCLLYTS